VNVFLSYSRLNASAAAAVAEDVRQMGHAAWFDREVIGGQAWWNAILRQIRECDLCILVLTPQLLESKACRAEFTYASQLNKTILPVLCHDGVKVNLLPPELSKIQFVDYRAQDKSAAFALLKAIQAAPPPLPPPNPLPAEPSVPISYLGDLRAQIESDQDMNLQRQRDLLYEVKRRLNDPESASASRDLLRLLRARQDLFASVAEEINDALGRQPLRPVDPGNAERPSKASPVESRPPAPPPLTDHAQPAVPFLDDVSSLDSLLKEIAATSGKRVLRSGQETLRISTTPNELVLVAIFPSWRDNELRQLRAMGWDPAEKWTRNAALGAFVLITVGTYGLGALLLLHQGVRHYLNLKLNRAVRRFPRHQTQAAAESIRRYFRLVSPEALANTAGASGSFSA